MSHLDRAQDAATRILNNVQEVQTTRGTESWKKADKAAVKDSRQLDGNATQTHWCVSQAPSATDRLSTQYPVKNLMREIARVDEDWPERQGCPKHWCGERFSADWCNC